jgi:hypothetical protein
MRVAALLAVLGVMLTVQLGAVAAATAADPLIVPYGFVAAAAYLLPGAVLLRRRDWHPVGWLLCLIALGMVVTFAGDWGAVWFGGPWMWWLLQTYTGSLFWLPFIALLVVFPDGLASQPRRHRRFGIAVVLVGAAMTLLEALASRVGPVGATVPSPLGRLAVVPLTWLSTGGTTLVAGAALLLAFVGLVVRYRSSVAAARRQYRWVVSAVVVLVATVVVAIGAGVVTGDDNGVWWSGPLLAYLTLPVAFLVAILRYRLYEIDRLVSRTVTFSLVVVVLGLVYVGAVALLTQVLPADNDAAVAASTLAAAALVRPLHRHVRNRVERRFNRLRFDAEGELQQFARGLRGQTDLQVVEARLVSAVDRTLRPATLSVWVRGS